MTTSNRVYAKLRAIIERHCGTMTYQRKGFKYGAWVIALDGKCATIKATGKGSFPQLDRLYVPKIVNLTRWEHTHNELLDDAEEHLLALLQRPNEPSQSQTRRYACSRRHDGFVRCRALVGA